MSAPELKIFKNKHLLAEKLAKDFIRHINRMILSNEKVSIALSGGSTPSLFFNAMVSMDPQVDWNRVRFYWVDERCVPPEHPESNFGVAYREFLLPLGIPETSYLRIRGEDDPEKEALRYGELIKKNVAPGKDHPVFDIVLLGMGPDGHTASVFPWQKALWYGDHLCTVGTHPASGQKRVTFTGQLINNAKRVVFMVTGSEKAPVLKKVIRRSGNYLEYPSSFVDPQSGILEWYLDEEAAGDLS